MVSFSSSIIKNIRQPRPYFNDNFMIQRDPSLYGESYRDSIGSSSEISSSTDAFSRNSRQTNNFNHITQHIQNNNNKITIIIKHDSDGRANQPQIQPQIIYVQPATTCSQPHLNSTDRILVQSNASLANVESYNSLDDIESEENYQFYDERPVDVPDDFKRSSYLVLNMSDAANKRLRRRICTPSRTLSPLGGLRLPPPPKPKRNFQAMTKPSSSNEIMGVSISMNIVRYRTSLKNFLNFLC